MQRLTRQLPTFVQRLLRDEASQVRQLVGFATRTGPPNIQKSDTPAQNDSWKKKLITILSDSANALTVEALWRIAEPEGFRSKRHMKLLLDDMRRRRVLETEPNAVNKSFGYRIGKLPRSRQSHKSRSAAEEGEASPPDMNEAQRSWFSRG